MSKKIDWQQRWATLVWVLTFAIMLPLAAFVDPVVAIPVGTGVFFLGWGTMLAILQYEPVTTTYYGR